jgi:hypothetical protein
MVVVEATLKVLHRMLQEEGDHVHSTRLMSIQPIAHVSLHQSRKLYGRSCTANLVAAT